MSRVNIPNGSITTVRLANDAVVSSKIKEGAVRTDQLADGAVTNAKITLSTPDRTSNDTTPATTAYVKTLIDDLVDSAPGSLDTLNEIAAALNDDANLGSALTTAIASSVSAEAALRASADSALSAYISNEVTVLNAAIAAEGISRATLAGDVAAETADRTSAITVETNARTDAITAEATARASAITSAVSVESDARASAITSAVSTEVIDRNAAISSAVSVETAARNSALDLKAPSANPTFTGVIDITDASLQVTVLNGGGSFIQVGSDIDGESGNSGMSVSISADGSIVAIGAPYNHGNGSSNGHVRVYELINSSWVQRGADIDGEAFYDESGWSVSLSADGSIVAIGAKYNYDNGSLSGHVRVYAWTGSSWVQRGTDIDGEAANDESGYSVSLSADGSIVAIGARYNYGNNGIYSGHVRVYAYNGTNWVQRGTDIDGEAAGDESGWSVSLSADGSIVAIGARYNYGNNGIYSGHVRVYAWTGSSWVQRGTDIDGEAANDTSGWSVSLSADGSVVAIGANGDADYRGHVRVYEYNGTSWVQRGADIDGEAAGDESGWSVSLSADGSVVAIGAPFNNGYSGHVRVYAWTGSSWVQRGTDIDGEAANDTSGWSVSLSADGSVVAIGANGNADYIGHVRVYEYELTTTNASLTQMELGYLKNTSSNIQTQIDTISAAVSAEVIDRNAAISDAITSLVAGAPSALDTLNEIASALNNDDNLASTLTNSIATVSAAVSAEAAARASAITSAVSVETAARTSAVSALSVAADDVLGRIIAETAARESADSVISAAVSAEADARESAITSAVSAEADTRESADSVISAAVSAETAARESADSVISAAVSAEADARESADSVISVAVSAEAAARNTALDLKAPLANPTFTGNVIIMSLQDFANDVDAAADVPLNGLYRTDNVVKVRLT